MRIDHYIHFVPSDLVETLRRIEAQGEHIMATVDQINAALAGIKTEVGTLAASQSELADGLTEITKDVAELVAKIGTGEPFTPEQVADAQATLSQLQKANAAIKASADALRDLGVATDASTVGASSQPVVVTPPADSGL